MRSTGTPARWLAAALLLAPTALGACSSSSEQPYCDALVSAEAEWRDAGASLADPAAATRFLRTVTRIEQQAPDEVRGDWQALHTLFAKFTVPNPDLGALTTQLKGFQSSAKRIETHARETCGVDLGS
ncbi:MAG: hypothetical protein ACKOVB_01865 [Terrabacter sp.]